MSLSPAEQFAELIKRTEHPLILIPSYPTKEVTASGIGLFHFLRKLGKSPTIAGENLATHIQELSFLSKPNQTLDSLSGTRDFVIIFNTTENKILGSRTETSEHEFRIYVTPEHSTIDPRDFSFVPAQLSFDLAIVIGSPDRESLGKIFEENPDIFYEIPIVNIDNKTENEQYGQLNLIDLTAASIGEILADLFESINSDALDEMIAEPLLTAIMTATESFQKKNTSPKSLAIASRLMERGADREKLVLHLYKTQPISSIRLWGRVMSGLKWHENLKLASSYVSINDFVETRSSQNDLPNILEKIRSNFSSASLLLVFFQEHAEGTYRAILKTNGQTNPGKRLQEAFSDTRIFGDSVIFSLQANSPNDAENAIIRSLNEKQ